ncbi:MAG TPA: hypothetical protein VJA26_03500 [Gammaproteobacteria bacterium]|nr:hypothetical protein [Gammaproteobacteria bacterium]
MGLRTRSKYGALIGLMRNERRSLRELVELQERKLQQLARHAYEHVPFYRRLFREAGIGPADIRGAADLARLPVVDKNLLRAQPLEDLIDRRVKLDTLIERHTSGSSGAPFRFFVDRDFDAFCKAQYLRPYLTNGRTPFDRVLRLTITPSSGRRWFQRLGLMREDRLAGDERPQALLAAFLAAQPDVLQGYPSRLLALAGAIEREKSKFIAPRVVFSDSELLTQAARKQIEHLLGARILDVFGSYETDNIGYECRERCGYHLAIDCVVPEFLVDGRPAAPGEPGELVCTVLHNYAMPLIRYNLQDIAARSAHPCACGRGLPLMSVVEGRTVDCVLRPDGTKESPMRFLARFDYMSEFALEYQVAQTAYDEFRVTLVPRRELRAGDREFIVGAILEQYPRAHVTVVEAADIPREPSGKRRMFHSEIRR